MLKRLNLYIGSLVTLAVWVLVHHYPQPTWDNLGWVLWVACISVVSLRGVRVDKDVTFHLDAILATTSVIMLGPEITLYGYLIGQAIDHRLREHDLRKFFFNTAVSVLQIYVLATIYAAMGGRKDLTDSLLALTVGTATSLVINNGSFFILFSILQSRSLWSVAKEFALQSGPFMLTEQTLGMLAVFILVRGGISWLAVLGVQSFFIWLTLQQLGRTNQERVRAEYAANHDGLTGLLNRAAFQQKLAEVEAAAAKGGSHFALAMLDLNGFKALNDGLGHAEGDNALRRFATELQRSIYSTDVVARLGGDEFAVLLVTATAELAHKKLDGLSTAVPYGTDEAGKTYEISAAIGVASYPQDGKTGSELLAIADERMYAHKRQMKGAR